MYFKQRLLHFLIELEDRFRDHRFHISGSVFNRMRRGGVQPRLLLPTYMKLDKVIFERYKRQVRNRMQKR